jgi:hypothetical protein
MIRLILKANFYFRSNFQKLNILLQELKVGKKFVNLVEKPNEFRSPPVEL